MENLRPSEDIADIINFNNQNITVKQRDENEMVVITNKTTLDVVNEINNLTLITPTDLKRFDDAKGFVLSTYTDVPQYRPLIIKLTSVLNDGNFPTPDAKYWQCKAEAEVHFNEMVRDLNKYKRALVDLKEIDYKIEVYKSKLKQENNIHSTEEIDPVLVGFQIEKLSIKRESYEFELKQMEKKIKYRMEEVTDWSSIADTLTDKCEFSLDNHSEHYTKSFIKSLEIKVSRAQIPEEKAKLEAQLKTFKRLTKEKFDELTKNG